MKSRVAQFIYDLFSQMEIPKNPLLGIFFTQLQKLTKIIDSDPELQRKAEAVLNRIKEEW